MKPPTILIAQGDEILRQNLKRQLVTYGFKVIEASDKISVLQFFQSGKPDLVIIGPSRNRTGDCNIYPICEVAPPDFGI